MLGAAGSFRNPYAMWQNVRPREDSYEYRPQRRLSSLRYRYDAIMEIAPEAFREPQLQACLNLWAAVLRLAIEDLGAKNRRAGAAKWLRSDEVGIGSFCWVCRLLRCRPEAVRDCIRTRPIVDRRQPFEFVL